MGYQNVINEDPISTFRFSDDFLGAIVQTAVSTSSDIWSFKVNSTIAIAKIAAEAGHPGIIQLRASANGALCAICLADEGTTIGSVLPADFFDITWICRPVQNDTNTIHRIGLFNPNVAGAFSDAIYFAKEAADNFFTGNCKAASTTTTTASFGAYDANDWYRFKLRRIDASTIGFSINDGTELTAATNVPTVPLVPAAYVSSTAAANKDLDIDFFDMKITGLVRY